MPQLPSPFDGIMRRHGFNTFPEFPHDIAMRLATTVAGFVTQLSLAIFSCPAALCLHRGLLRFSNRPVGLASCVRVYFGENLNSAQVSMAGMCPKKRVVLSGVPSGTNMTSTARGKATPGRGEASSPAFRKLEHSSPTPHK